MTFILVHINNKNNKLVQMLYFKHIIIIKNKRVIVFFRPEHEVLETCAFIRLHNNAKWMTRLLLYYFLF